MKKFLQLLLVIASVTVVTLNSSQRPMNEARQRALLYNQSFLAGAPRQEHRICLPNCDKNSLPLVAASACGGKRHFHVGTGKVLSAYLYHGADGSVTSALSRIPGRRAESTASTTKTMARDLSRNVSYPTFDKAVQRAGDQKRFM